MSTLLEAENLEIAHGAVIVCSDLSLTVAAGEIVSLIGANGAGKTTTLCALAGVLAPRRGRIRFAGEDVTRLPSFERVRRGIAMVPEGRRVFPQLSVHENLEMGGYKHRADAARLGRLIERAYGWFPRLEERAAQRAGTLSGGEQQMLALARAMMSEPILLCLDEPSLGLAPLVVQEIFRTVRAINAEGTSVLLVEQNARYALETASRGYVLQTGAIIASGSSAALRDDARVKEAYLGRGARR
jgi:branched-chain amino acid transport system ATP-binding protein